MSSIQVNVLHVNSRQVDKNNLSMCHLTVCITKMLNKPSFTGLSSSHHLHSACCTLVWVGLEP